MTYTRHTTISITEAGDMERRQAELPAAVACALAPVRVSITEGTDHRTAARLLRRLADEIERQGEATP
jgi:hypothetical protein